MNRIENRIGVLTNPCHSHSDGSVVSFLAADMADTVLRILNRVHTIYWNHRDQLSWMGQIWIVVDLDDPAQRILQFLSLCNIYCSGRGLAG